MKRRAFLVMVASLVLLPVIGRSAAPGSPEDVVERAMESLNRGKLDAFLKFMNPDALNGLRTSVLEVLDVAVKKGKQADLLQAFQGVSTPEELKALDGGKMFAALIGKATADPDAKKALASTRIEAIGRFAEGKDKAYVVYRSRMKLGELDVDRLNVATLQKSGADWKLSLLDDFAGRIAAMKRGFEGDSALPDLRQTRVELLGHVMEGKKTAMVVYRAIVPVGESSVSQLAVHPVNANDAGWDAARKDDADAVRAMIEKSLGIRRATPEEAAARQAQAEKMLADARARMGGESGAVREPRTRRSTAEAPPNRPADAEKRIADMKARVEAMRRENAGRSGGGRLAVATDGGLPDGLTARPSSFFSGDRDRFQDVAPEGGVLVGARVSYIVKFGGPKISSVQPVYRVGAKLVDGKRYGKLLGKETKAVAKEGYAVGAVNTHTGLTVDGFELVFMKVDGDHLDASKSYTSSWLGDERGGSPRNVPGDGKIAVGLQGRADDEVKALGLIVRE